MNLGAIALPVGVRLEGAYNGLGAKNGGGDIRIITGTANAIFNLGTHPSRLTRIVAFLMGGSAPGATWLEHVMIRDRAAAREQVGRMLAWTAERIVLAHGEIIQSGGTEVIRKAYAWL